jgi:hypothetical protein
MKNCGSEFFATFYGPSSLESFFALFFAGDEPVHNHI